jgi:hypothetical protein
MTYPFDDGQHSPGDLPRQIRMRLRCSAPVLGSTDHHNRASYCIEVAAIAGVAEQCPHLPHGDGGPEIFTHCDEELPKRPILHPSRSHVTREGIRKIFSKATRLDYRNRLKVVLSNLFRQPVNSRTQQRQPPDT